MRVTVVRPLHNANTEYFHVHAEGCKDLGHRKYGRDEGWTIDADSRDAVVEDTYHDQIHSDRAGEDPAAVIAEFTGDFNFHNCTKGLPAHTERTTTMTTATLTDRFTGLLEDAGLEVVAEGYIVNEAGTAEMINVGHGWLVRGVDDGDDTAVLMDRWEAARTIRDWDDDEALAA